MDDLPACIARNFAVGIVLFDELTHAPHGHSVYHIKEVFRSEFFGRTALGFFEFLFERADSHFSQVGVVAEKVSEQVLEVVQRVVYRRGGEQHELLARVAIQQFVKDFGPLRGRIAKIVGFVNHHERELV